LFWCSEFTARIAEEPEEFRVGRKHQRRVRRVKRLAIRTHGTLECEESGIFRCSLGEDLTAPRLALTPQNFCFLACLSKRFYHLPVSNSANTLSRFTTASPQTLSFGKTFCLHSIIGLLRNFCCQIGTTNTHIFDRQAKRSCIRTQLIAHFT